MGYLVFFCLVLVLVFGATVFRAMQKQREAEIELANHRGKIRNQGWLLVNHHLVRDLLSRAAKQFLEIGGTRGSDTGKLKDLLLLLAGELGEEGLTHILADDVRFVVEECAGSGLSISISDDGAVEFETTSFVFSMFGADGRSLTDVDPLRAKTAADLIERVESTEGVAIVSVLLPNGNPISGSWDAIKELLP